MSPKTAELKQCMDVYGNFINKEHRLSGFGINDFLERKPCNKMNTSLHYSTCKQF